MYIIIRIRYILILLSIIYINHFVSSNINFNNLNGNNPNVEKFIDKNGNILKDPDGKQLNINEILKKLEKETEKNGHNFHIHQFIGPDGKRMKQIATNDPEHQTNLKKIFNIISEQNLQKNNFNSLSKNEIQMNCEKDPITSCINNYIIDGEGNHILIEAFNNPSNDNKNLQHEQNYITNEEIYKDNQDFVVYYQHAREDIKTLVNFNNSNKEHSIFLYWTSQFADSEDVFMGEIKPLTSLSVSTFINHIFYATRKNSKLTREFPHIHRIIENIQSYSFKPVMIVENVLHEVQEVNLKTIEGLEFM